MSISCTTICDRIDQYELILDELSDAECKGTDTNEGGIGTTRSVRYTATLRALELMYKQYERLGCSQPDLYELRQEVIVSKPCTNRLNRTFRYR